MLEVHLLPEVSDHEVFLSEYQKQRLNSLFHDNQPVSISYGHIEAIAILSNLYFLILSTV